MDIPENWIHSPGIFPYPGNGDSTSFITNSSVVFQKKEESIEIGLSVPERLASALDPFPPKLIFEFQGNATRWLSSHFYWYLFDDSFFMCCAVLCISVPLFCTRVVNNSNLNIKYSNPKSKMTKSALHLMFSCFLFQLAATAANETSTLQQFTAITDNNIHHAVREYVEHPTAAEAKFGPIDQWDTSQVTNLDHLFSVGRDATLENFDADISNWNVESVTSMKKLFFGNQEVSKLSLHSWNVAQVTDASFAFAKTKQFEGRGLGNWNLASLVNASHMFSEAEAFNGKGVHAWDVPSLQDATRMFHGAKTFQGSDGKWTWSSSNLHDMTEMFAYAENFEGDVDGIDVSNVKDMKGAFFKTLKFNSHMGAWDTKKVHDMNSMFAYATTFEGHGVSNWNVHKVTTMANMMKRSAFHQDVNQWNVSAVTDLRNAFRYAHNMTYKVCWDLNEHANVEGIFFESSAYFDEHCVKHKFRVASCCHPTLDKACECGETSDNPGHDMEQDSSSSQRTDENTATNKFGAVVGFALVASVVMFAAFMWRRYRANRKLTTTMIHTDDDFDACNLHPSFHDSMTTPSKQPRANSTTPSTVGSYDDCDGNYMDNEDLGTMEDIPVQGEMA